MCNCNAYEAQDCWLCEPDEEVHCCTVESFEPDVSRCQQIGQAVVATIILATLVALVAFDLFVVYIFLNLA